MTLIFKNRKDAGDQLAEKLAKYHGSDAVVLALPRGGVVLGYEIAKALDLPLDIISVRKIGHPNNPEYAICAVNEYGLLLCDEMEVEFIDKNWLKKEILQQQMEAQRRSALYRGKRKPEEITGKIVIIVDDGIATGLTIQLAIRSVKMQSPKKIVVAVPVAPSESKHYLYKEGADEIVMLESPEEFMGAVGAHYMQFEQVGDNEVVGLLKV